MRRLAGVYLGLILFICGIVLSLMSITAFGAYCLLGGIVIMLGMAIEQWRYKKLSPALGAKGRPTGERFVDPETGALVEVWYDAATGERSYVKMEGGPRPPA